MTPVARIWRWQWGQWHAELWRPRTSTDPPLPHKPVRAVDGYPEPVPGYVREAFQVRSTRRRARRAARTMLRRYQAGLPAEEHPEPAVVEVVV